MAVWSFIIQIDITNKSIFYEVINMPNKVLNNNTDQDSDENVQDVKPSEDIVKVQDYEQRSTWSKQAAALSSDYNFVTYMMYDAHTENPDETNDVLFDINVNNDVSIQDSPVAGAPQSNTNSGKLDAGTSYSVTAVACDADGNKWFRVGVDGRTVWVSEAALTANDIEFKDANLDKEKYENVINSDGYKTIEDNMAIQSNRIRLLMESLENEEAISMSATQLISDTEYKVASKTYRLVTGGIANTGRTYLDYANYMGSMTRIMGLPPQWSKFVDPTISYSSIAIGRRYSQLILSNPTIVSLCPGALKFSKSVVDNIANVDFINASADSIAASLGENGVDMLWKFVQRWDVQKGGYLNYVNAICRYAVQCMSTMEENAIYSDAEGDSNDKVPLKDKPVPQIFLTGSANKAELWPGYNGTTNDNSNKYSNIDVSGLLGSTLEAGTLNSTGSLGYDDSDYQHRLYWYVMNTTKQYFDNAKGLLNTVKRAITTANQYNFVHFAANGQANVRESFSTETRASVLESSISGSISDVMKDVSFMVGTGIMDDSSVAGDIDTLRSAINASYGSSFLNILDVAMDIVKGGTVSWPQMVGNVSWGREYTFNVKFMTPYGDTESRFLNVILPYVCLMCLWLPKQMETAMDMYTWPFVVQAYAKGIFACPAGVLTNIEVSHGGGEETGWTGSGHQTEVDVSFSITPLHTKLSMSGNNFFFLKNVGLQNYMGTICGVDLTMPQDKLIAQTAEMLWGTWWSEIPARLEASIQSRIHDSKFFQLISHIVEAVK